MQPKMFLLAAVLMLSSSNRTLFAYPIELALASEPTGARESWDEQGGAGTEQRNFYGQCLHLAETAQKRDRKFLASMRGGHFEPDQVHHHWKDISLAIEEMLQVHDRFMKSLNETQWAAARDEITKLQWLRATIHAQLTGIDYELQMPNPQAKVVANYTQKIAEELADWRKLERGVGAAVRNRGEDPARGRSGKGMSRGSTRDEIR